MDFRKIKVIEEIPNGVESFEPEVIIHKVEPKIQDANLKVCSVCN